MLDQDTVSAKSVMKKKKNLFPVSKYNIDTQYGYKHHNPDKCKVMHVGHQHKPNYMIHQDNTDWNIQEVTEEKDLGVLTTYVH